MACWTVDSKASSLAALMVAVLEQSLVARMVGMMGV